MKHHYLRFAALVAGAALALTACSGTGGEAASNPALRDGPPEAGKAVPDSLTGVRLAFAAYGGTIQEAQMEASAYPFGEITGADVVADGPVDYAKIQAQVEGGNVSWDVVQTDLNWAASQCGEDGLFAPLDETLIDTSKIPEGLWGECYVPAFQYAHVIMWNTDRLGDIPDDGWDAFFDTQSYPGKRAIFGDTIAQPGIFEGALLADGVARDELYPLDFERALRKLDTIRDDLIFWTTGAESTQMMMSEEAVMVLAWSGRGHESVVNGAPYTPIWDDAVQLADGIGILKNGKNLDAAQAFVNFYLGAEAQTKLTELTSYSPVNVDANPQLDEVSAEFLTTSPEIAPKLVPTDPQWWADNYDETARLWQDWLQKS